MMVVGRILGIELIVKCAEFRPLLGLPMRLLKSFNSGR